jgi:hypothetical protein
MSSFLFVLRIFFQCFLPEPRISKVFTVWAMSCSFWFTKEGLTKSKIIAKVYNKIDHNKKNMQILMIFDSTS